MNNERMEVICLLFIISFGILCSIEIIVVSIDENELLAEIMANIGVGDFIWAIVSFAVVMIALKLMEQEMDYRRTGKSGKIKEMLGG